MMYVSSPFKSSSKWKEERIQKVIQPCGRRPCSQRCLQTPEEQWPHGSISAIRSTLQTLGLLSQGRDTQKGEGAGLYTCLRSSETNFLVSGGSIYSPIWRTAWNFTTDNGNVRKSWVMPWNLPRWVRTERDEMSYEWDQIGSHPKCSLSFKT